MKKRDRLIPKKKRKYRIDQEAYHQRQLKKLNEPFESAWLRLARLVGNQTFQL